MPTPPLLNDSIKFGFVQPNIVNITEWDVGTSLSDVKSFKFQRLFIFSFAVALVYEILTNDEHVIWTIERTPLENFRSLSKLILKIKFEIINEIK